MPLDVFVQVQLIGGFLCGSAGKQSACSAEDLGSIPGLGRSPGEGKGSSDGKVSAYNAGGLGSIPGLGKSPGEGNGNPLQYPCLENLTDRGAW